ncbi:MAG: hypothetical protein PF485_11620 [Bacteroidales bacterium]|nr:hypothetical protein [Bacteroidales bacterium]
MITYKFNTKLQILEVIYEGSIQLNDLMEFGNEIYGNDSLPRQLLILTDVTKAQYNIKRSEFQIMIDMLKEHVKPFQLVKAAFIQNKPKETAYSLILEMKNKLPNYYHSVFSTREAALSWLLQKI